VAKTPAKALATAAAKRHGIPVPIFHALVSHESGWQANVGSSAGAYGWVQIHLPSHPSISKEKAADPRFAFGWGAKYLRDQYDRFGSWKLALAAYNAGPGAVEKYNGVPPYAETERYVTGVLAQANLKGGYPKPSAAEQVSRPSLTSPSPLAAPPPPAYSPADLVSNPAFQTLGMIGQGMKPTEALAQLTSMSISTPTAAPPTPITTPTVPTPKQAPDPQTRPAFPFKPGGGWGGSQGIASGFAQIGQSEGLAAVSEKRSKKTTTSGSVSDHYEGNQQAYAYDLSNGDRPTPEMDRAAIRMANLLGVRWRPGDGPLEITKVVNGYRVQVLYRTDTGGNHFNHIHVGVRRFSG
jgi:hypothetical protein